MAVETGTTISDLVSTNPVDSDDANTLGAHDRLTKSVLKTQFPGAGGSGFNTPILATEAEINYLQNVTSNIQTQLDALSARITALGG